MGYTLGRMKTALSLALLVPLLGCSGTVKRIKKKLDPTAKVLKVSVIESTPERLKIRVDVVTKDADLLLGFLKLRYNFMLEQASADADDEVKKSELAELSESGASFIVTIPTSKAVSADNTLRYSIRGAIVVKIIAELAEIPFSLDSSLPLN
jgi:hypothetical protein